MHLTRTQFTLWTVLTALLGGLVGAVAVQRGVPTLRLQHDVSARHLLIFTTPSTLRTNNNTRP